MTATPEAEVLGTAGKRVTIRCPYCRGQHVHQVHQHGRQHYAPKCGMFLSPDDRGRGYRFTTGATGRPNRKDTTDG